MGESRIAISVWGVGGGAFANVAALLAKGLTSLEVDVDVVHLNADGHARRVELPDPVHVVPLNASRSMRSILPLARYLRSRNPSALVSIGWMQNSPAVLAKVISRWQGVLILSEHGLSMSYERTAEGRPDFRYRILPVLSRFIYPIADGLAVVSDEILHDMIERVRIPPAKLSMRVIPNAVDIEDARRRGNENVAHPWGDQEGHPLIVNVGRLHRQKNQRLLLEAFSRIRADVDARLIILGEGPERGRLERAVMDLGVSGAVSMPGFVPNPMPYFVRADVSVLSSEAEGWPLALMESMAVGCPVIATSVGAVPELLEYGRAGFIVPEGNVTALSQALVKVSTDHAFRSDLAEAATRRVTELTPARVAAMWLSFMGEMQRARDSGGSGS